MLNKIIDEKIEKWIASNKNDVIESWMELVKIPSVKGEAEEHMPFGKSCADALNKSIDLFKECGFSGKVYADEGYGLVETSQADKTIGLFSHCDVVPAGDGWLYTDPFVPVIKDGSLIGRGAEDNKAGVMASYCVFRFFKDCDVRLKSKLVAFVGADEECGMQDLKNYLKKHTVPDISFVPDADFPCSVGEKGIYHFYAKSRKNFKDIIEFKGGEAGNIVLDKVTVKIKYNESLFDELSEKTKDNSYISVTKEDDLICIVSKGIAKHASIPEGSLNAAYGIMSVLCGCEALNENDRLIFKNASHLISDNYGKGIGISHDDPNFGKTTSVNGICKIEDNKLCMSFDVRYGDTLDADYLERQSEITVNSFDFDVCNKDNSAGFSIDKNSKIPDVLEGIFNEVTGLGLKRVLMSGGTYARRLNNAFSIGTSVVTKGREDEILKMPEGHGGMHQADEKIDIKAFFDAVRILIHYIIECDKIINE